METILESTWASFADKCLDTNPLTAVSVVKNVIQISNLSHMVDLFLLSI